MTFRFPLPGRRFVPVAIAAVLVGACSFDLLNRQVEFDPVAPQVAAARTAASAANDDRLDAVLREVDGFEVVAEGSFDECETGQKNWKVDTGFAHRCEVTHYRLAVFDGHLDAQMTELAARFTAGRCGPDVADARERLESVGRSFRNFPDGYPLEAVDGWDDDCSRAGGDTGIGVALWLALPFDRAHHADAWSIHGPHDCGHGATYCNDEPLDLSALARAGDRRWAVVAFADSVYWELDW